MRFISPDGDEEIRELGFTPTGHPLDRYLRQETPFCAGCGNGVILNAFLSVIDEDFGSLDSFAFFSGIGCASWIPNPHLLADAVHTTHGRSIPVATGAKLANPKLNAVVISGDGDLAAIGGGHLFQSARRNVEMLVILVNNRIYGMTGGQCGPLTPEDAVTLTTPFGNPESPYDLAPIISAAGASFCARWTVAQPKKLKEAIRSGLERSRKGFAFLEVISTCPTQYGRFVERETDPVVLYHHLLDSSVPIDMARKMSKSELEGKITVGTFRDQARTGFSARIGEEKEVKG